MDNAKNRSAGKKHTGPKLEWAWFLTTALGPAWCSAGAEQAGLAGSVEGVGPTGAGPR